MSSAIGLEVNRKWVVGRKLGEGAQASVHALSLLKNKSSGTNNDSNSWVIKLAKLPEQLAAPKRKKSELEINADALNGEFHFYLHFRSLQGTMIPRVEGGGGVGSRGEIVVKGRPQFRYLVVEQMDAPFFSLIDSLLLLVQTQGTTSRTNMIPVGPIFQRLIEIIQAFHTGGRILVDVKADNLMLKIDPNDKTTQNKTAAVKASKKSVEDVVQTLASQIRFLDFALAQTYFDIYGKHRENTAGNTLVGTPLYSSLHVHDGHTASRRDDVFAIGLIMAELVLRLQAKLNDTAPLFEDHTAFPSYLPWANEKSEHALGACKRTHLMSRKSTFYQRFQDDSVASTFYEYFMTMHKIEHDKKPKYADLVAVVANLHISYNQTPNGKGSATTTMTARVSSRNKKKTAVLSENKTLNAPSTSSSRKVAVKDNVKKSPARAQTITTSTTGTDNDSDVIPVNHTGVVSSSSTTSSKSKPPCTARASCHTVVAAATPPLAAIKSKSSRGTKRCPTAEEPVRQRKTQKPSRSTAPSQTNYANRSVEEHSSSSGSNYDMDIDSVLSNNQASSFGDDNEIEMLDVDEPSNATTHDSIVCGMELRVKSNSGTKTNQHQSYYLLQGKGRPKVAIIGSNPSSSKSSNPTAETLTVKVSNSDLASSHIKLTLVVTKSKSRAVRIENLCKTSHKSSSTTTTTKALLYVNDKPASMTAYAVNGSTIRIGSESGKGPTLLVTVHSFEGQLSSLVV